MAREQRAEQQRRIRSRSQGEGPSLGRERDEVYDLVSIMYHALDRAEAYGDYVRDAERAGDEELADFFEECSEEATVRAARAKRLLRDRIADTEDENDFDEARVDEED